MRLIQINKSAETSITPKGSKFLHTIKLDGKTYTRLASRPYRFAFINLNEKSIVKATTLGLVTLLKDVSPNYFFGDNPALTCVAFNQDDIDATTAGDTGLYDRYTNKVAKYTSVTVKDKYRVRKAIFETLLSKDSATCNADDVSVVNLSSETVKNYIEYLSVRHSQWEPAEINIDGNTITLTKAGWDSFFKWGFDFDFLTKIKDSVK